MATDIVMPSTGESIAEGTVIKWLIRLAAWSGPALLEVETERWHSIFPAPPPAFPRGPRAGRTTVPVGTVLARLEHEPVETVMSRGWEA